MYSLLPRACPDAFLAPQVKPRMASSSWMQVFNHYSNLGTGSMIANYGFTYSNNMFTTVTLQLSGPLQAPANLHSQPGPAGPASSELLVLHACCSDACNSSHPRECLRLLGCCLPQNAGAKRVSTKQTIAQCTRNGCIAAHYGTGTDGKGDEVCGVEANREFRKVWQCMQD